MSCQNELMNRTLVIIIVVVVIIAAGAYYMFMNNQAAVPSDIMTKTEITESTAPTPMMDKTIQLSEQNESSQSGTAVLVEKDGKVMVTLNMIGGAPGVPQPAHIHVGSCPDVGAVAYPLTNVVDGVSETTLDVTLEQLKAEQPLGINVHKSAPESKIYVSCGNLAF